MSDQPKQPTPKLDELEGGPWPSFVRELKRAARTNPMAEGLIGVVELSYDDRVGHWKHGGVVGVRGYGAGVIGRYSDVPEKFPEVAQFHTMRVNHPAGWFYTTDALRRICDLWEKHGSGLTNLHGATGDIILLGTRTEAIEPAFADLTANGFDLGGSGSVIRTPSCCVGPARCEWACFDTLDLTYNLTMAFQDEIHRPSLPYKFKIKASGCPNDCVAAIARADLSIIGTWRDSIEIDQEAVKEYARQKPRATSEGEPRATAEGEPRAAAEGEARATAEGEARATAEGEPRATAEGEPRATAEGEARATAEREPRVTPEDDGDAAPGVDIRSEVCERCPSRCVKWDGERLEIDEAACVRCMHCINVMPKALRPGRERGACILIGGKAPIVSGAMLSSVLVPFMKLEPPYTELKDLIGRILEVWAEDGKNRERVGEFIQRVGLGNFLEAIGLQPAPEMVKHPRENPYVFYEEYFEDK